MSLSEELGFLARMDFAMVMDKTSPRGRDWRGLVDLMGFSYEMIVVLQTRESPTLSLLEEWERHFGQDATLESLILLVEELGCQEAVDILRQATRRRLRSPRHSPKPSSSPIQHSPLADPNMLSTHKHGRPSLNSLSSEGSSLSLSSAFGSSSLSGMFETLSISASENSSPPPSPPSFSFSSSPSSSSSSSSPPTQNQDGGGNSTNETLDQLRRHHYDVFLSFAEEDVEFAEEVKARLQNTPAGPDGRALKVFIAAEDLMPGKVFSVEIAELIKKHCRKTVILLSPAYLQSEWCRYESYLALHNSPSCSRHLLIPILYQRCEVPSFLSFIYYLDYPRYSRMNRHACDIYFWNRLCKSCVV